MYSSSFLSTTSKPTFLYIRTDKGFQEFNLRRQKFAVSNHNSGFNVWYKNKDNSLK